jgi:hypothetical protein
MMLLKKHIYIFIFICVSVVVHAGHPRHPVRFSKWNTGILLQKYYYNTYHSKNAERKISFLIGLHQEFTIDGNKNKNFISIGTEFIYQSFAFQSYYFTQDTLRLYNNRMDYSYRVRVNELCIPLLYKHNFSRENNDIQGIYFSVGYVYRVLLPSSLDVSKDGQNIDNTKFRPEFKIPVFNNYGNSYVHLSIGFQKNNPQGKSKMYAEIFGRYGFSPFYVKTSFSANNLYFGNYFIGFSVGIKWRR